MNFNTDQRRDKGFGPALGPDATDFLKTQFHSTKFQCLSAKSPWLLGSADYLLTESLINGISECRYSDGRINKFRHPRLENL